MPICVCVQNKAKQSKQTNVIHLTVLTPLILLTNLLFFLGSEIVLDVEGLANLLRGFALDEVSNRPASKIEELMNVEVVCGKDEFKDGVEIDLAEFLVPIVDGVVHLCTVISARGRSVAFMMIAVFNDLLHDL